MGRKFDACPARPITINHMHMRANVTNTPFTSTAATSKMFRRTTSPNSEHRITADGDMTARSRNDDHIERRGSI